MTVNHGEKESEVDSGEPRNGSAKRNSLAGGSKLEPLRHFTSSSEESFDVGSSFNEKNGLR
jgi:hypothetical protein